jgi:hypothetical protein
MSKEKRTITNPVTGKRQQVGVDSERLRLVSLGFDESGKVIYQETVENDVPTFRGYLPDAVKFLRFDAR